MKSIPSSEPGCSHCTDELAHCHATLVVHVDGDAECLDSDCVEAWESHPLVATCLDIGWTCDCQKIGNTMSLAA